mmetsp:Transcript_24432/g.53333  ORF Transcript_24432/g.53333 Transcript_24432/m.53333 type:complete len:384 (+) Transcript_24432:131-1282(+)
MAMLRLGLDDNATPPLHPHASRYVRRLPSTPTTAKRHSYPSPTVVGRICLLRRLPFPPHHLARGQDVGHGGGVVPAPDDVQLGGGRAHEVGHERVHPPRGLQQPRLAHRAGQHRLHHRAVRPQLHLLRVAHQKHVHPRAQPAHHHLLDAPLLEGAHLEVVGDGDAVVADVAAQVAQRPRAHAGGEGARGGDPRAPVQSGHRHVRQHDGCHARVCRRLEGGQLHLLQAGQVVRQGGQLEVRVLGGVAVPREVLRARGHPLALHLADERAPHGGHHLRRPAERPRPDDRVVRVGVNVHHGGCVEVDVYCPQLATQNLSSRGSSNLRLGGLAEDASSGDFTERGSQASHTAAFLVYHNQQRSVSRLELKISAELGHLFWVLNVTCK